MRLRKEFLAFRQNYSILKSDNLMKHWIASSYSMVHYVTFLTVIRKGNILRFMCSQFSSFHFEQNCLTHVMFCCLVFVLLCLGFFL